MLKLVTCGQPSHRVLRDCPTPVHTDKHNVGITLLIAFQLKGNGGHHVVLDRARRGGYVVEDAPYGVACYGPYRSVYHANMKCGEGVERFVLTAYCGEDVAAYASKH